MFDWTVRILLFTQKKNRDQFQSDKFQIIRSGKHTTEVDMRFSSLNEGLKHVSDIQGIRELCIFMRGESIPLNGLKEEREGVLEGVHSMSEEKYWLAHEIFEDFWKHFEGEKNRFYHGVVLLCVAMVHFQMQHESNALRLFGEAKRELNPFIRETDTWDFSYPLKPSILKRIEKLSLSLIRP